MKSAALSLGGGAYMSRTTYCPRCGLQRVAVGPFGDCTRCAEPGFISDEHEASEKRKAWERLEPRAEPFTAATDDDYEDDAELAEQLQAYFDRDSDLTADEETHYRWLLYVVAGQ